MIEVENIYLYTYVCVFGSQNVKEFSMSIDRADNVFYIKRL